MRISVRKCLWVVGMFVGAATAMFVFVLTSPEAASAATGPTTGYLRATTSPPVPSQIIVDGVIRDTWGLIWADLPPGIHTVAFSHVTGYAEPAPQTITITAGQTTTVQGNFVARGSLRVITSPALPSTVFVDGVPRDRWGCGPTLRSGRTRRREGGWQGGRRELARRW